MVRCEIYEIHGYLYQCAACNSGLVCHAHSGAAVNTVYSLIQILGDTREGVGVGGGGRIYSIIQILGDTREGGKGKEEYGMRGRGKIRRWRERKENEGNERRC